LDLEGYEWLRSRYDSEDGQRMIEKVRQLSSVAADLNCSLAQLGLAWCLKNPNVSTVITGASRAEQVSENMQALDLVSQLDDEIMERIETILENKPEPVPNYRE
jgi:aryl-alcohol dehydrogenase-like predicted oxidoreductase